MCVLLGLEEGAELGSLFLDSVTVARDFSESKVVRRNDAVGERPCPFTGRLEGYVWAFGGLLSLAAANSSSRGLYSDSSGHAPCGPWRGQHCARRTLGERKTADRFFDATKLFDCICSLKLLQTLSILCTTGKVIIIVWNTKGKRKQHSKTHYGGGGGCNAGIGRARIDMVTVASKIQ